MKMANGIIFEQVGMFQQQIGLSLFLPLHQIFNWVIIDLAFLSLPDSNYQIIFYHLVM